MRHFGLASSTLRAALALVVLSGTVACGDQPLLSAPLIRDADNDNVVFIGDSIFALSGEIQTNLYAKAGGTFRNYTASGAELNGVIIAPSVPQQFAMAEADNPNSSVVVLDAGGNDILIPTVIGDPFNCVVGFFDFGKLSAKCRGMIDEIYVDGVDFLNDMAAQGVTDGVFLGYYHLKNGLLGKTALNQAVDYGDMRLAQACQAANLRCTFVDPRQTIVASDILPDGVHPNSSGSAKLANLLFPTLAPLL